MKYLSLAKIWTPEVYDRVGKYHDFFFRRVFPIGEKGQQKVVEGLDSGSILDVACGTATLLAMAYGNGLQCYGIDTFQGMLNRARAKFPNAELTKASFYDIRYPNGYCDHVVETNTIDGMGIDARKVLSGMIRLCKNDGEVRIADYSKPPRETWENRLLKELGILVGDLP